MDALLSVREEKDWLLSRVKAFFKKKEETCDEFTSIVEQKYNYRSYKGYNDGVLMVETVYTLSSKEDYPEQSLIIVGMLANSLEAPFKLLILTPDNERYSCSGQSISVTTDSGQLPSEISGVTFTIPYEVADKVLSYGVKFSFRCKDRRFDFVYDLPINHSAKIFRLMQNDNSFNDDEIDQLYDSVCDDLRKVKKMQRETWENLRQKPECVAKQYCEKIEIEDIEENEVKRRIIERRERDEEEARRRAEEKEKQQREDGGEQVGAEKRNKTQKEIENKQVIEQSQSENTGKKKIIYIIIEFLAALWLLCDESVWTWLRVVAFFALISSGVEICRKIKDSLK